MFEFFCEQEGHQERFRFGRDGSPAVQWCWEDLDLRGRVQSYVYPGCVVQTIFGDTQSAFLRLRWSAVYRMPYARQCHASAGTGPDAAAASQPGQGSAGGHQLDRLGRSLEHLIELSWLLLGPGLDLMVTLPVGRMRRHAVRKGIACRTRRSIALQALRPAETPSRKTSPLNSPVTGG